MKQKAVKDLVLGLQKGDRRSLAEAITLAESQKIGDRAKIQELLVKLSNAETKSTDPLNTLRIGVTGPPGVGKSTWIEAMGMRLIQANRKLCVLTIDPSSPKSGGSILGDKTRMPRLSSEPACFGLAGINGQYA